MNLTLVVPSYSAGPTLQRTIDSCRPLCDEVLIVATALYDEDLVAMASMADQVVGLPWNHVFIHGFGSLYNSGSHVAKNDWLLLLGVAETIAEPYCDIEARLNSSLKQCVFRCDHHNDINTWKRIWNRKGGTHWSGLIHEEIVGGVDGGVIFRMMDTEKVPDPDPVKREAFRYLKTCSYHWNYSQLRLHPEKLGGTDRGWLAFVEGSKEANESFLDAHHDLLDHCLSGNLDGFKNAVEQRVLQGVGAIGKAS